MTFSAQVAKVGEPRSVDTGKMKQDVLLCNTTGTATLSLWEDDIHKLVEGQSYQMDRLMVRSFQGKNHLSMPPSGATIEEIDDLQGVKTPSTASVTDEIECLSNVTVTGVQQLESVRTCISCKKST